MAADKGQKDLFSETEAQKTFRELKDISTELIGFHVRVVQDMIELRGRIEVIEARMERFFGAYDRGERP